MSKAETDEHKQFLKEERKKDKTNAKERKKEKNKHKTSPVLA